MNRPAGGECQTPELPYGAMRQANGREDPQRTLDLLAELALRCVPEVEACPAGDEDLLARLYLLRDTAAAVPELGVDGTVAAEWISRAAMLVRDEGDREQAHGLLQRAAARLAAAARAHHRR